MRGSKFLGGLAALVLPGLAQAAEIGIGPFAGVFLPSEKHELYDTAANEYTPYSAAGFAIGARLGVLPVSFFGVEGEVEAVPVGTRGHGGAALFGWRAHVIGLIPLETVQPFLVVGGGNLAAVSKPEANGKDVDGAFHVGVGSRFKVNDGLFLRADLRDYISASYGIDNPPANHFEVTVGATFALGKKEKVPDTDLDGFKDDVDACLGAAETVNGWNDTDGCPDDLAHPVVVVLNEDGEVIPDVKITLGGQPATANAEGKIILPEVMPGTTRAEVTTSHPWYADGLLPAVELGEGLNESVLKLDYLPGKVRVITKNEKGAIVDTKVTFEGPRPKDPVQVGDDGQEVIPLRPGTWRIFVSAETFGVERRDITLKPAETSLVVIEVVMKPALTKVITTEIKALEQVNFEFNSDKIVPASEPLLREVAVQLLQNPAILKVEVQGHTDDKGDDAYNLELSQKRVDAIVRYLVGQGVAPERLVAKGYGETMPIDTNATEAGRAKNRRVAFVILEQAATRPTP